MGRAELLASFADHADFHRRRLRLRPGRGGCFLVTLGQRSLCARSLDRLRCAKAHLGQHPRPNRQPVARRRRKAPLAGGGPRRRIEGGLTLADSGGPYPSVLLNLELENDGGVAFRASGIGHRLRVEPRRSDEAALRRFVRTGARRDSGEQSPGDERPGG